MATNRLDILDDALVRPGNTAPLLFVVVKGLAEMHRSFLTSCRSN